MFLKKRFLKFSENKELKYKGSFKQDLEKCNKSVTEEVFKSVMEIKKATSKEQIQNLKKLRKYKSLYRIKIAEVYRIGIIIKKDTVWLVGIGHRNNFYKDFP